ncbi:MAG: multiheme c-type cytochrome [Fimbriimonas sp.]
MMRFVSLVVALAGLAIGAMPWPQAKASEWVILVGGDTDGYLAPCGCTKPMSGGIRRRASAIESLRLPGRTLVLENGGLVAGEGRQDVMKAETMAQFLQKVGADAVHLTPSEGRLGKGGVLSISRLLGSPLVSGSVGVSDLPVVPTVGKGPFLVGAASVRAADLGQSLATPAVAAEAVAADLVQQSVDLRLAPILMLAGTKAEATAIAQRNPKLRLVVYRSNGAAASSPTQVGSTWLVSPGEKGKAILRLSFADGRMKTYAAVALGPSLKDEPAVARFYRAYLGRVSAANLLNDVPREETTDYAGSKACITCHQTTHQSWSVTDHARALRTLEDVGHDRDPDCVSCHVVGLESTKGFRDRLKTPELANVGCESCHGPGKAHTANPKQAVMGKVGEKSCRPCHVPDHSPGFDFLTYWRKISHK